MQNHTFEIGQMGPTLILKSQLVTIKMQPVQSLHYMVEDLVSYFAFVNTFASCSNPGIIPFIASISMMSSYTDALYVKAYPALTKLYASFLTSSKVLQD